MKKISWYDMQNLHYSEIKKKYKVSDRQMEQGVRRHMDGANAQERRELYGQVWDSRNKK